MTKRRVHLLLKWDIICACRAVARDDCVPLSTAVENLLEKALAQRQFDYPTPGQLRESMSDISTLIKRTWYLVVVANILLKHHPIADLSPIAREALQKREEKEL